MDWNNYQLDLFHVIQNAIKYNNNKGEIEISCYL